MILMKAEAYQVMDEVFSNEVRSNEEQIRLTYLKPWQASYSYDGGNTFFIRALGETPMEALLKLADLIRGSKQQRGRLNRDGERREL